MTRQRESRLSGKIMLEIRARGWFCNKNHGSEFVMAGLPDITVCAEGYYVGLEVKLPSMRHNTSARQDYVHGKIQAAGGVAIVVCSPAEAVEAIDALLAKKRRLLKRP
jgi:hypothetical protein